MARQTPPTPPTPKKGPVTWSNYREIVEAIPPPTFDPAVATPEDWASYNSALSKCKLRARSFKWTVGTCVVFALGFGERGEDKNRRAFQFAMARHRAIFKAFAARRTRTEVLKELQKEWAKAQEQAPGEFEVEESKGGRDVE